MDREGPRRKRGSQTSSADRRENLSGGGGDERTVAERGRGSFQVSTGGDNVRISGEVSGNNRGSNKIRSATI